MISARHWIQTGSWTEAWKAGLTNEIQSSTVTWQPNVQTLLHSGLHGPGHDISGSYSNPRIVVYSLSFNIYLLQHSFFFNSIFLNLSLILVSSPSFPYAFLYFFRSFLLTYGGWRSWFRHCATSWKVAGSIPDGVTGIFHWYNPSVRTMALRSTKPLTKMITRNISWGIKVVGA